MPETKDREKKEWTLMFYFASDNPLAPNIVPQLKAIKNAGFHQSVNVIAQFDPEVEGMPTQIFDVNLANKLAYPDQLSFNPAGNDPFVRSLVMDKLWGSGPNDEKMRAKIARHLSETRGGAEYDPPIPPNDESAERGELGPKKSLPYFLQFCAKNYPARHFMLFILGHGLVVGNHMFLFDANADEATISLADLAKILNQFKKDTKDIGEFELVSFHSCSMSSLELAYELQGTANYMLASQGPNFVGSYPYREMLIRAFNDQTPNNEGELPSPRATMLKFFSYILSNSFDFQLAGYSFDLCLSDLRGARETKESLVELSGLLIDGLRAEDPLLKELILLAHWDAQSFWQESYTDLFDFCFCLNNRCEGHVYTASEATRGKLEKIQAACSQIVEMLKPGPKATDSKLIVRAEFGGPEFQYSHGLSVYFPWSQPSDKRFWPGEYSDYRFKETGWGEFLGQYFKLTQRKPVWEEVATTNGVVPKPPLEQELLEEIMDPFNAGMRPEVLGTGDGKAGGGSALGPDKAGGGSALGPDKAGGGSALGPEKAGGGSALGPDKAGGGSALGPGDKAGGGSALSGDKAGGGSATGGNCGCSSIKNYPKHTRRWPASRDFFKMLRSD
ncbi:MAG: hypothetical protein QOH42_2390 [Blastocatellia bacterium]|nr:hypothetical protein [Blastocatellia bacterium]